MTAIALPRVDMRARLSTLWIFVLINIFSSGYGAIVMAIASAIAGV